jgi:RNA polymerase sigma-70 factor (ECF subfamily)
MVMIQGESLGQRAGTLAPPDDPLVLLDTQDDESLLARLRAGDESAFRALVDRHRPWLVRHCTRLLGYDAHAAEDAAQETLLKLHAAARRDARPLRVRAWLTVVARNTCIDEQRRRRPDLPGELPERPAPGDDPFSLDAALAEAWPRLSGRHREVLYLREVLGFSYKEIGAVMGLSMPAVETLVFRARAALRREYERAGGTALGCGLFGFHLARVDHRTRRNPALADSVSNAAVSDAGSFTSRLAHFVSTSLPGCGEQALAKLLSVAAGVAVATAAVLPGVGPFGDSPAEAAAAPDTVALTAQPATPEPVAAAPGSSPGAQPASLKSLLGSAAPANWTPQRSRSEATRAAPTSPATEARERWTPLRDAAETWSSDRPTLRKDDVSPGPLRSLLPPRPDTPDRPERPVHPLRSLLESFPTLLDPLPVPELEPVPTEPVPGEPVPTEPVLAEPAPVPAPEPEPDAHPIREAVQETRETVFPLRDTETADDGIVADRDADLLRRQDG